MIDIEKYLIVPYLDGGRDCAGMDCWGQVLAVRAELKLPVLPSLGGVTRATPLAMAREYTNVSSGLQICEPRIGAIAAVFRGSLMVHVGIVVEVEGRLAVLETNPRSGPRWLRVRQFVENYAKVIFYCDPNLPE